MLKVDDLGRQGIAPTATVSTRCQRVTDFHEGEKLNASFGLLCESLVRTKPRFASSSLEPFQPGLFDHLIDN